MAPSMSVAQYYADKCIFITGATGFMGKVLVEKLLRSCPDVKRIYILLRPKKGQSSTERLEDFVNCRIFDTMQTASPRSFDKLRLVGGDILQEKLAMSDEDRSELERECQIVFHCAACVRFDQNLRDAVNLNTCGTKRILELAEQMKKLEVFLHVSTTYCHCELDSLEEKLYPTPHQPRHIVEAVQWMDDDLIEYLEKKIIHPQPNTYAYTKALTEELVSQYAGKFPIAIARPSIVTAALKEPIPGWVDNMNGPTGLLVGAGKGVIRTMLCQADYQADVIPVDVVINATLVLAYDTALEKPKDIQVVNMAESGLNPISWGAALEFGRYWVSQYPFSVCLWYPDGGVKSSRLLHNAAVLFTHLLPAYLLDFMLFLTGNKTFLVRIQKKVSTGLEVLQYYTNKQWHFKNDNFASLKDKISEQDNKIFFTDVKTMNWNLYIRDYVKGAREFCCKEDPATLPQARKLYKRLYYLDRFAKIVLSAFLIYFVYSYAKVIFSDVL